MKIYLTTIPPNSQTHEKSDSNSIITISNKHDIDRVIKNYVNSKDTYIYTSNPEHTLHTLRFAKTTQIHEFNPNTVSKDRKAEYLEMEKKIRAKLRPPKTNDRRKTVNKRTKEDKGIPSDENDTNKGLELSFEPDIFRSVRTSLVNPEIYISKDCPATIIFKSVTDKISVNELRKLVKKISDDEFEKGLKSLIFSGVLLNIDGDISINPLLTCF